MKLLLLLASVSLASTFFSIKYYIGGEDAQISHGMTFTRHQARRRSRCLCTTCGAKDIGEKIAVEKEDLPRMQAAEEMPILVDLHGACYPLE